MPKKSKVIFPYIAKARIAGRDSVAEGATLEEAVSNLKPVIKKGVCLLTVKHGDTEITKILSGPMTFKLFNDMSRFSKEVALKNLKTLFVFQ